MRSKGGNQRGATWPVWVTWMGARVFTWIGRACVRQRARVCKAEERAPTVGTYKTRELLTSGVHGVDRSTWGSSRASSATPAPAPAPAPAPGRGRTRGSTGN